MRSTWIATECLIVGFLAALLALAPREARGQARWCAERGIVIQQLFKQRGETWVAAGVADDGNLVERFESTRGTWSIITTTPRGRSCIEVGGYGWRDRLPGDLSCGPECV